MKELTTIKIELMLLLNILHVSMVVAGSGCAVQTQQRSLLPDARPSLACVMIQGVSVLTKLYCSSSGMRLGGW